jgi:predicted Zn-dependent protease
MASSIPIPTTTPGCNSWCWKPRYQQAENRIAREDFLRRIDRMVFADSPRQGVIRNSDFYHAELGIALQFPPGWRIQNRTQKVEARSPQDDVLIELAAAGPAQGPPSEVLRRFARLGSGEVVTPSTINGLPAAIAVTRIRGLPTRVVLVFLGKTAYAIGAQAQSTESMNRHMPAISATQSSFHALTERERALAWPPRLRVITAKEGMTFAGLARTSPLGSNAEGYLRLINAKYPAGEPGPGQALKIVE